MKILYGFKTKQKNTKTKDNIRKNSSESEVRMWILHFHLCLRTLCWKPPSKRQPPTVTLFITVKKRGPSIFQSHLALMVKLLVHRASLSLSLSMLSLTTLSCALAGTIKLCLDWNRNLLSEVLTASLCWPYHVLQIKPGIVLHETCCWGVTSHFLSLCKASALTSNSSVAFTAELFSYLKRGCVCVRSKWILAILHIQNTARSCFVFALIRSNWLKPCCGRRVALWQVCLLSAGFNCILVACVMLVVLFLSLELLIDTKLLQCKWMLICLRFVCVAVRAFSSPAVQHSWNLQGKQKHMEKVWFQMSVEYDYSWTNFKFSFCVLPTSPLYYCFCALCLFYKWWFIIINCRQNILLKDNVLPKNQMHSFQPYGFQSLGKKNDLPSFCGDRRKSPPVTSDCCNLVLSDNQRCGPFGVSECRVRLVV